MFLVSNRNNLNICSRAITLFSIRNINAKKKEKIAVMASGSSLSWRNSVGATPWKAAVQDQHLTFERQNYSVVHLHLTCACKYLRSSSKLYTNTLKRSDLNIFKKVNVTSTNFTHHLNNIITLSQDWHEVNLTLSI